MDKNLITRLRQLDEVTLLELLNIDSSMLVDAFLDIIDEKEDLLYGKFSEEEVEE